MTPLFVLLLGTQQASGFTTHVHGTGLTLQQAQTLPAAELAQLALGMTGSRYREVRRPHMGGLPGARGFSLSFATAPGSAGFPGLCRADVIDVYFWPSETDPASDQMWVNSVHTESAFKIVGDTTPLKRGRSGKGAQLDDQCATAGPVFASNIPGERQSHFYFMDHEMSSPADAYFAARALQQIVENARANRINVTCTADSSEATGSACADPRAVIANLDLGAVHGVEVDYCGMERLNLCVEAGFFSPPPFETRRIGVSIRTDALQADPLVGELGIEAVHVEHNTIIDH